MMPQRRVVVTGIGAITPYGSSKVISGFKQAAKAVRANLSVVRSYPEWSEYKGLRTRLGADIAVLPDRLSLKQSRSMGRVAQLAYYATEDALIDAGIECDSPLLTGGRFGISYGSGIGSTCALKDYARFISERSTQGLSATTYHRVMSHTCAANIGIVLKMTGRVIPTSSACTSGSQAIGYGYETIKAGLQDLMICGGAEEFAPAVAAIFDVLGACSLLNDKPDSTPRPFDRQRDGIVIAESACTLILEELEHAQRRGAKILAEIIGFATNSDGYHITNPRQETMTACIRLALDSAKLKAEQIDYVNAHATGTIHGDLAEVLAIQEVFHSKPAISSLKGHLGHTLGACGALETALTIWMMHNDWIAPNRNLKQPMLEAEELNLVLEEGMSSEINYCMKNTFAFGGINTSLILGLDPDIVRHLKSSDILMDSEFFRHKTPYP